jgi:hypothetical protein
MGHESEHPIGVKELVREKQGKANGLSFLPQGYSRKISRRRNSYEAWVGRLLASELEAIHQRELDSPSGVIVNR